LAAQYPLWKLRYPIMSNLQPATLLPFRANSEPHSVSKTKDLLCVDPRSQTVLKQLDRLAPTDATVLIVGETGTGKEVAARYIHERSGSRGPFVAVNCGALSESLVEAELFGHEAGAFTGAQHARAGWFEVAQGGTLFLDEIGDMPLYLQVRLLRVLQERQVVRIGSRKPIPVEVRLIAATNIDLEQAVQSRQFRRDLYYRLSVAPVELPPLRERRADILPLARNLMERHRSKLGLTHATLTPAAEEALLTHHWPGNIRELENVIHLGLIMSAAGKIDVADLRLSRADRLAATPAAATPAASTAATATAAAASADAASPAAEIPPRDVPKPHDTRLDMLGEGMRRLLHSDHDGVYQEVERLLLTTAFEHCAGNQVRTAKRLGVSRNVVRAQLKRFGLIADMERPAVARNTGLVAPA
jgi:sigma-54-specific transcriptional regulator